MLLEKLISPIIPTLLATDSGTRALGLMEDNNLNQLPLIINNEYTTLVQEQYLSDLPNPDLPLGSIEFPEYKPAVIVTAHPFDAIRIAHAYSLDIIPVVDGSNTYLGAISRDNLFNYFSEHSGLNLPGGIIVLEVPPRDYSLAEIARICENDDITITCSQLSRDPETGLMQVTLKTNRTDLSGISRSFDRYGYVVKEVYGAELNEDLMLSRYQLLMNYLNI